MPDPAPGDHVVAVQENTSGDWFGFDPDASGGGGSGGGTSYWTYDATFRSLEPDPGTTTPLDEFDVTTGVRVLLAADDGVAGFAYARLVLNLGQFELETDSGDRIVSVATDQDVVPGGDLTIDASSTATSDSASVIVSVTDGVKIEGRNKWLQLKEMNAYTPPAGPANTLRLYTTDNGGVTELHAIDSSGNDYTLVPTAGGPTGPSSYLHTQTVSSTTWTITHGLSFKPNVSVVDSSGREIVPGAVDYTSTTVTLTFSAAVGGEAYLS